MWLIFFFLFNSAAGEGGPKPNMLNLYFSLWHTTIQSDVFRITHILAYKYLYSTIMSHIISHIAIQYFLQHFRSPLTMRDFSASCLPCLAGSLVLNEIVCLHYYRDNSLSRKTSQSPILSLLCS